MLENQAKEKKRKESQIFYYYAEMSNRDIRRFILIE